jgi:ankyrin repeat protein
MADQPRVVRLLAEPAWPERTLDIRKMGYRKVSPRSTIVDLLLGRCRNQDSTACAYIYCSSEYPFLSSEAAIHPDPGKAIGYKAILGSILHQLYGALPEDRDVDSIVLSWKQGASILESHLEQAIRDVSDLLKRSFIVIDGLDELQRTNDADFGALCKFIESMNMLPTASTCRSILVLSRPDYVDISAAMQASAVIRIDGQVNRADISAFVSQKVASLGRMGRYEQQMKDDLVGHADGVFRWVSAAITYVQHMKTPRARAQAVKNMPPGLKDVYAKILERILQQGDLDNDNYAVMALLWVTHAFRPLSPDEMTEALSIEPGMEAIDDHDRIDSRHIDELCEHCHGLLELSGGVYRLPHDSVRDFLLGAPDPSQSSLTGFWELRARAHERIAEACLTYLCLEAFDISRTIPSRDMEPLHQEYSLLRYTSHYWGDHVREVGIEIPVSLSQLAQRFLLSDNHREVAMHAIQNNIRNQRYGKMPVAEDTPTPPGSTVPFHLIAIFGLQQHLPGYGYDQTAFHKDQIGFLPIDYAVIRKWKPTLDWILDRFSQGPEARRMETDSDTPLTAAAASLGWADSLQTLLDLGFDKAGRPPYLLPLHCAADAGSLQALRVLLNAEADINALDSRGQTPLWRAAQRRQSEICTALIDYGADINVKDRVGRTALHVFAGYSQDLVEELLKRNVAFVSDDYGFTPLHVAATEGQPAIIELLCYYLGKNGSNMLHSELDLLGQKVVLEEAAKNGLVNAVEVLIGEFGADLLHVRYTHDSTFLHLAAYSGEEKLIPFIAGRSVIDPNAQDVEALTALNIAAMRGHDSFASRLLKTYPNLDPLLQDIRGMAPLHSAASRGHHKVVALLSGWGSDLHADHGRLSLHWAAFKGNLECVRLLVHEDNINKQDVEASTALHIAALSGNYKIARYLLDTGHTIAKDLEDTFGRTPLHFASRGGHADIVTDLVSAGFDALHQDAQGWTPLMHALQLSPARADIAHRLLVAGREALNLLSKDRWSCADFAATFGTPKLWNTIWDEEHKYDPHCPSLNPTAMLPLVLASRSGNVRMVEFLASSGHAVNGQDGEGATALITASVSGYGAVIHKLLELGADVHCTDQLGRTALHWAAIRKFPRLIHKLLESGSVAAARDNLGLAAVDYARSYPSLRRGADHHSPKICNDSQGPKFDALNVFIVTTGQKLSIRDPTYYWSLQALSFALRELGRTRESSIIATAAIVRLKCRHCNMCAADITDRTVRFFRCLECYHTIICEPCHDLYRLGKHSLEKPHCRRRLEKLELETRLFGRSLYPHPLIRFSPESFGRLLRSSHILRDFVERKWGQYRRMKGTWPRPNTLDPSNFAWQLIRIVRTILGSGTLGNGFPGNDQHHDDNYDHDDDNDKIPNPYSRLRDRLKIV